MGLDSFSISSLRKNFEKLIVREEIETWESSSFGFEVVFKTLLNFIEGFVVSLESFKEYLTGARLSNQWVFLSSNHDIFPEFIDKLEHLSLSWELLLNILSIENIFQVHP